MTTYGSSSLSNDRICCGMRSYISSLISGNFCAPETRVSKNGEATVRAGADNTLPRSGKAWPGCNSRAALILVTMDRNCHDAGSMKMSEEATGPPGRALAKVFVSTQTPLNRPDQAAVLVWLTDNKPRAAL